MSTNEDSSADVVDLDALDAAEKAATPRPWFALPADGGHWSDEFTVTADPDEDGWRTDSGCPGYGIKEADARFVAALRNSYRAMSNELRLRRARDDAYGAGKRSIEELIDASSLGEPGAKEARARVPDELIDAVLRRGDELEAELVAKCTPGIRKTVAWLRSQGFATVDSGDGITNVEAGMEDAMEIAHVAIVVDPAALVYESFRLKMKLEEMGVAIVPQDVDHTKPGIQASFDPADGSAVIVLACVDDALLFKVPDAR